MKNPIATIKIKELGELKLELCPEFAPNTVRNFVSLSSSGFYDGLVFHRIIPDFMVQGGDPDGNGTGGPGYHIKGEFYNNGFENPLKHETGVISMARSQNRNSAGSQFFIMTANAPHLDGDYAAFGRVIDGMEQLLTLGNVETDFSDRPKKEQIIEFVRIETFGENLGELEKA